MDERALRDPDEGALLVLNGQVTQIGGTSWSAPVWAGFCALINEARIQSGEALIAVPQSHDLSTYGHVVLPGYHHGEQRRI